MCNPEDFSTESLIMELSHRRGIKCIKAFPIANKVEIVIDDCNRSYTKFMPDGKEYLSPCVYDEFHYNCRGILILENGY